MSDIVITGSQCKSPTEAAIARVLPWTDESELWQRFGKPELLWLAMIDAGGQFRYAPTGDYRKWEFVPPSDALTTDEAVALAWGRQALARATHDISTEWLFYGSPMFSHSWTIAYAAKVLGVQPKRVWEMLRDGAIGGWEVASGSWRIAPGSVKRHQQRQQQAA